MPINNISFFLVLSFVFIFISNSFAFNNGEELSEKERYVKIDEYLRTAKKSMRFDIHESLIAAQKAKELSLDFDDHRLISSNLIITQIYQHKGIIDTAMFMINNIFEQLKNFQNDTLLAEAYHTKGLNYQFKGSIALAIESYHNALKINESLGIDKESVRQLNNIGLLYREEEEYDLALKYLEDCLSLSRAKGLRKYEYYSYGNIGYIFMKQNKWEEALERFEKVLEPNGYPIDTVIYSTINYLISDVKLHQKDFQAAKEFAYKALNAANHIDYAIGKTYSRRVLSDIYRHEKNYDKAREIAHETLADLGENSANLYLEDVLKVLYNLEYETEHYQEALGLQKRIFTIRDSLHQIKTKEKISNSEYKYQLLKNEQENELLKIKNDSSEKTAILATTIAFLLFLLVSLSHFFYRKSKDYNDTLEKAIEERTKELENSNIDLAKSNEELERFAFIASHDLKTPLRDIVSFTGLLERELQSNDNEKIHEYLSFIKKGGLRLNKLIIDTLEYSRLSYVKKENRLQIVDLNVLFKEIQLSMSNYIKEKNAEIIISSSLPAIEANHSSLILLFQNLLENSIKYNKSATPNIKIHTKEKKDFLSVYLEDNGIGISKEYHDEIFVMFSRLHTQNEFEGSGLGLSICKKVIDQLNGEIHIQSDVNKGSTFEIKIPSTLVVSKVLS